MKVRSHLALLVGAVLAPTIIFSIMALSLLMAAEREASFRSMQELARATMLIMDKEMARGAASASALATSPSLQNGQFAAFYDQAKQVSVASSMDTAFIGEDGQQVFNTVRPFGAPIAAPSATVKQRVGKVFAGGVPVYSNLIKGSATKRFVVSLEHPTRLRDGRRFLISQWIYVSRLNALLPTRGVAPTWLISVFDRDGITIARNHNADAYVGEPPRAKLRQAILARHEGISRSVVREGVDMYGAWAISPLTGWSVGIGVPVEEIERAAVKSVALTAIGFLAALLAAGGGALVLSRRLVAAITSATSSADQIGLGRLPPPTLSGVEEMDQLHQSLQRAAQLLLTSNAERDRHVRDAEQARAESDAARLVAESQNRSKDEFLAMLGHELRNPLAAITSGVALLNLSADDPTRAGKATEIIARQTRHLVHIVDELLDAHRILSGKLTLTQRAVDLAAAVQACLAAYEARGANRSHRITTDLVAAVVCADPTRLEQMISNLVENAVKYTPDGGAIHIKLQRDQQRVVLSVTDSGIGIAADVLPTIFQVFVQGKVVNRSKGGLGIGLAVVNALARQHGASLKASSAGIGKGSTFSLEFLLSAQSADASDVAPARPPHGGGSLLVIEDNRDVRELMCNLLREVGFDVAAAATGRDGLDLAAEMLPDAALIDIDLPDMTGYDIARTLRAAQRTEKMRLIAVTGYGQHADRQAALASGFDAHLTKPVNLDDVLAAIGRPV